MGALAGHTYCAEPKMTAARATNGSARGKDAT